ncbi:hypothetical protein LTR86_008899 [Recurvomyces mirabilis]|nr:hypothetical protein LTR86_008899 [Recurvomyces mirabilis]
MSTTFSLQLLCAALTYVSVSEAHTTWWPGSYVNSNNPADPGPGVEHHEVGGGGNSSIWPYQIFKSAPYNPPVWEINATGKPLAPGLLFQPAQIYRDDGQLVWFGTPATANNFKWQIFNDEPTLTFWSGVSSNGVNTGHGYGNITFLDTGYNVKTVLAPHFNLTIPGNQTFESQADLHESYLTDRNTILVTAYNATQTDLTAVNGTADGWVFDCLFFEIDPNTGEILFRWSALEHVPVTASHQPLTTTGTADKPYDYFHINSVANVGAHFLVNSRHTWTIYYLDSTGKIDWRFAGDTGGDFGPLPAGGSFRWQHHPRAHNVTKDSFDISLFNNNNQALDNSSSHPTNTLVYHLPMVPDNGSSAILRRKLVNNPPLFADSQGSYQPNLFNRNQLATFGQLPIVREYGPAKDGSDVRWTGRAGHDSDVQTYRGFKEEWHAIPATTLPSLVVLPRGDEVGVYYGYVSWNGVTDVDGWNVYLGSNSSVLEKVGTTGYRGFETRFDVVSWAKYAQVGAVVHGSEVKRSSIISL